MKLKDLKDYIGKEVELHINFKSIMITYQDEIMVIEDFESYSLKFDKVYKGLLYKIVFIPLANKLICRITLINTKHGYITIYLTQRKGA